ncbi:MAG TPA: hypothetical protein VLC09_19455, partial [Polyangiaceae bacterium]|nr:hypothetical protein [Polyangiaceae bacterium]
RLLTSFVVLSLATALTSLSGCVGKRDYDNDDGLGGSSSTGGSDSTGGSPGSATGGSSAEPGELGASCDEETACDSGHCVDGVCCETACDGVCASCSAEGTCEAPESDTDCAAVTCEAGTNDCLDYGDSLEGGSCKGLGQCKTSSDCPSTPKAAQTACEIPGSTRGYCDGAGECVLPVVTCAGACTIGSNVCCYEVVSGTSSFVCEAAGSCPSSALSANPAQTPVTCDDHGDCRTDYLCSMTAASGGSGIACLTRTGTTGGAANYDGTYQDNYEVCQSPSMAQIACSNGAACTKTSPNFPGWKFCNH